MEPFWDVRKKVKGPYLVYWNFFGKLALEYVTWTKGGVMDYIDGRAGVVVFKEDEE